MKAYNTPNDTLTIKSDGGEELVSITPEGASIKNLDGSSFGFTAEDAGKILVVDSEGNLVPQEKYTIELTLGDSGYVTTATAADVDAAYRAGKQIVIVLDGLGAIENPPMGSLQWGEVTIYSPLTICSETTGGGSALNVITLWFNDIDTPYSVTVNTISFD